MLVEYLVVRYHPIVFHLIFASTFLSLNLEFLHQYATRLFLQFCRSTVVNVCGVLNCIIHSLSGRFSLILKMSEFILITIIRR